MKAKLFCLESNDHESSCTMDDMGNGLKAGSGVWRAGRLLAVKI